MKNSADIVSSVQGRNAGQSSRNYNAGGFFLNEDNSNTMVYEEYSPGEDDGLVKYYRSVLY